MRGAFYQTRFQPPRSSGALKPYVEPRDLDAGGREDAAYLAAVLGVISVIALAASFIWAHHWGPLAYTIVRISESYIYADVIAGRTPDVEEAVSVIGMLLRGSVERRSAPRSGSGAGTG